MFPMHPHSGIATLTVLLSGRMSYEDTLHPSLFLRPLPPPTFKETS
jgi:redox-sensitive bicupin YhaK (pirin superfamily)